MKNSSLRILLLVVGVLIFALFLMESENNKEPSDDFGLLLPEMQGIVNSADFIRVLVAGKEPIEVVKMGSQWEVPARKNYAADFAIVRKVLVSMAQAKVLEPKTANPSLHGRLGVEATTIESSKGVDVLVRARDAEFNLIFGNIAQGQYRYARIVGDNQSWLIDQNPDIPIDTSDWLQVEIIDIDSGRVKAVTITHPDGETITVNKASEERPNFEVVNIPQGRELTYSTVGNGMGGALNDLDSEDVRIAIESGEAVTTEFTTFDGLSIVTKTIKEDDANWVSLEVTPEEAGNNEATEIIGRVAGWQYQIADYKFNLLTRRQEDILKPLQDEAE